MVNAKEKFKVGKGSRECWEGGLCFYVVWPGKASLKFENRPEGSKGSSQVDNWGESFQAEGTAIARALR